MKCLSLSTFQSRVRRNLSFLEGRWMSTGSVESTDHPNGSITACSDWILTQSTKEGSSLQTPHTGRKCFGFGSKGIFEKREKDWIGAGYKRQGQGQVYLWVWGQPDLHIYICEFQVNLGYTMRSWPPSPTPALNHNIRLLMLMLCCNTARTHCLVSNSLGFHLSTSLILKAQGIHN